MRTIIELHWFTVPWKRPPKKHLQITKISTQKRNQQIAQPRTPSTSSKCNRLIIKPSTTITYCKVPTFTARSPSEASHKIILILSPCHRLTKMWLLLRKSLPKIIIKLKRSSKTRTITASMMLTCGWLLWTIASYLVLKVRASSNETNFLWRI